MSAASRGGRSGAGRPIGAAVDPITAQSAMMGRLKQSRICGHLVFRTAEGAETYFAWSFYLPEALAATPPTQIGYWESNNTYNQMMSFEVVGQNISFATRKPMNKVHWEAADAVTPGVWRTAPRSGMPGCGIWKHLPLNANCS